MTEGAFMAPKTMDEKALKSYLLGLASEEQQLEMEEWLLNPDNDATPLKSAKNELIDEFLDGKLKNLELRQFHTHFMAGSERPQKVQLVESLRRLATIPTPPPDSIWTIIRAYF